jgi:hypothetical protein
MRAPPKLPLATPEYNRAMMDRLIRDIELYLEGMSRPGNFSAVSLRLTGLAGASTLSADMLAGASTVSLDSAARFPTSGTGRVGAEIFSWSGTSGNDLTGVVRGLEGTTDAAHFIGDVVISTAVPGTVYANPTTNVLMVTP